MPLTTFLLAGKHMRKLDLKINLKLGDKDHFETF